MFKKLRERLVEEPRPAQQDLISFSDAGGGSLDCFAISEDGEGSEVNSPQKSHPAHAAPSDTESEREDLKLDNISKEQLMMVVESVKSRYRKYKAKALEYYKSNQELTEEIEKLKKTMAESQDRSLRRVGELREQCQLEQQAKAHLEDNLRTVIEEKDQLILVLQTQIKLLKDGGGGSEDDVSIDNSNIPMDLPTLQERVKRQDVLLYKCKETLQKNKERLNALQEDKDQLQAQVQQLMTENKDLKVRESIAREELNLAQGQLKDLTRQREDSVMAMAETKHNMHLELEQRERQLASLRNLIQEKETELNNQKTTLEDVVSRHASAELSWEREKATLKQDFERQLDYLRKQQESKEQEHQTVVQNLNEALKSTKDSLSEAKEELGQLHSTLDQLKQELDDKNILLAKLESLQISARKEEDDTDEKGSLDSQIDENEHLKESLLKESQQKIQSLEQKILILNNQLQEKEASLSLANEVQLKFRSQIEALELQLAEKISVLSSISEVLDAKDKDLNANKQKYEEHVKSLNSKLKENSSLMKSYEAKIENLSQQLSETVQSYEEAQIQITSLKETISAQKEQCKSLQTKLKELTLKVQSKDSTLEEKSLQLHTFQEKLEGEKKTTLRLHNEIQSKDATIETLKGSIEELNSSLQKLHVDSEVKSKENKLLQEELSAAQLKVKEMTEILNQYKQQLECAEKTESEEVTQKDSEVIRELRDRLEKSESELSEAIQNFNSLKSQNELEVSKTISAEEKLRELEKILEAKESEINISRQEILELKEHLREKEATLKLTKESYEKLVDHLKEKENELNLAVQRVKEFQDQLRLVQQDKKELLDRIKQIDDDSALVIGELKEDIKQKDNECNLLIQKVKDTAKLYEDEKAKCKLVEMKLEELMLQEKEINNEMSLDKQNISELELEVKEKTSAIQLASKRIEELMLDVEHKKAELKEKEENFSRQLLEKTKEITTAHNDFEEQLKSKEAQIKSSEQSIIDLKGCLEQKEIQFKLEEGKIKDLLEKVNNLQMELASAREKEVHFLSVIRDKEHIILEDEKELANLKDELNQKESLLSKAEHHLATLQEQHSKILAAQQKEIRDVVSALEKQLEEQSMLVSSLQDSTSEEISRLQQELIQKETQFKSLNDHFVSKCQDFSQLEQDFTENSLKLEEARTQVKAKAEEVETLYSKIEHQKADNASLVIQLEEALSKIKNLEENNQETLILELQSTVENNKHIISHLKDELSQKNSELKANLLALETCQEGLEHLEDVLSSFETLFLEELEKRKSLEVQIEELFALSQSKLHHITAIEDIVSTHVSQIDKCLKTLNISNEERVVKLAHFVDSYKAHLTEANHRFQHFIDVQLNQRKRQYEELLQKHLAQEKHFAQAVGQHHSSRDGELSNHVLTEQNFQNRLKQLVREFSKQMELKDQEQETELSKMIEQVQEHEDQLTRQYRLDVQDLQKELSEKSQALDDLEQHCQQLLQDNITLKKSLHKEASEWENGWEQDIIDNAIDPKELNIRQEVSCQVEEWDIYGEEEVPQPLQYEYLKNILFEYMMGKEPFTLAKVIATVMKFPEEQTKLILERIGGK